MGVLKIAGRVAMWLLLAAVLLGVLIDHGFEMLVLLLKAAVLFSLTGLLMFIGWHLRLVPRSPEPRRDVPDGPEADVWLWQLMVGFLYFWLAVAIWFPLETYLIEERGWTWLRVEPPMPDFDNGHGVEPPELHGDPTRRDSLGE